MYGRVLATMVARLWVKCNHSLGWGVARFLLCRKYSTYENKEKTVLRTPRQLDADPDPAFHLMRIWIRILPLIQIIPLTFFPELYPPGSNAPKWASKASNFSFYPYPAFYFDADPDPPFTLMRFWIRIRTQLLQIRNTNWETDASRHGRIQISHAKEEQKF